MVSSCVFACASPACLSDSAKRYADAVKNNQSVLPYIIEDAGNVTMVGSVFKGVGRGGVF